MKAAFSLVVLALMFLSSATAQDKDKKPVESILIKVTAADVAKEFAKDAKDAAKKYNPEPPMKGGLGGTIIEISGEVEKVTGKDIELKTETKIKVRLKAKKVDGPADGRRVVESATGKFKEFKNNTIVIEVGDVTLKRVIGEKDK